MRVMEPVRYSSHAAKGKFLDSLSERASVGHVLRPACAQGKNDHAAESAMHSIQRTVIEAVATFANKLCVHNKIVKLQRALMLVPVALMACCVIFLSVTSHAQTTSGKRWDAQEDCTTGHQEDRYKHQGLL